MGSGGGSSTSMTRPGFATVLTLAALPPAVTRPSRISAWTRDLESPSRRVARKTSMRIPSSPASATRCTPVGSAAVMPGGGALARSPRPARAKPGQHCDGQRYGDHRDELRRGQPHDRTAFVAAVELDDEPRDAVEQDVEPEGPPGECPAAAFGGEQEHHDEQLRAGVVQ